jgi:UDP-N-acetyl-D-glucosamine dehydrogenase
MPFYPGPGLGGHCIPIDPFYLTWKSREFDMPTRFIELAGEINLGMPRYVIARLEEALDARAGKSLGQARILVVGLAYKKNVADVRESPSFKLMELLEKRGAAVSFHDPHVPVIPPTREHGAFTGRRSTPLTRETILDFDAVLIATDHDDVDYALIAGNGEGPLVVDARNAFGRRGLAGPNIVKA